MKNITSLDALAKPVILGSADLPPEYHYIIDSASQGALRMALATGRPLLIKGEPGIGKTELARAAAKALEMPLYESIVVARTEAEHLLFEFDYVRRLADAQAKAGLDVNADKYLMPRELWWAFDPTGAQTASAAALADGSGETLYKAEKDVTKGCVLLIDEIDKADSDVPNSLLDVLDRKRFFVPMTGQWITAQKDRPVLVVLTTNGERNLPPAFLRRCVIHTMKLENLEKDLATRARAHFPKEQIGDLVLKDAIVQITVDREAQKHTGYQTGVSELIDLLGALYKLTSNLLPTEREARQIELLKEIAPYVLSKGSFNDNL
jgi:MoxR-like ATPase